MRLKPTRTPVFKDAAVLYFSNSESFEKGYIKVRTYGINARSVRNRMNEYLIQTHNECISIVQSTFRYSASFQ